MSARNSPRTSRRGVSVLEVLLAASILACALVPILGSIQSSGKEARLLEYQSQALARARGCLEAARVLGPRVFDPLLEKSGPEAVVPVGMPATAPMDGAAAVPLLAKMQVHETVTVRLLERCGPAGLYLLKSRVAWTVESEPHAVELVTMQSSPLVSINSPTGAP